MGAPHRSPVQSPVVIVVLLIATGMVVYWPVQFFDFLIWDDHAYVVDNPHVRTGLSVENLLWALTTSHASYWHPVTWLSHMLDCQLYGLNPQGHHLGGLLIHVVSSVLLFLVLKGMTASLWRSAFVAALFCLHPLRIESVAWVSERKDVLGTFFWMTTVGAYLRYVNRPGKANYLLMLLSFGLGLMAKPILVVLPFVLVLLDYWPLGRTRWVSSQARRQPKPIALLLWEKLPLFILTAISSAITFIGARGTGAVPGMEEISLGFRIATAVVSYVKYLWMTIWPADLSFFYPYPTAMLPLWQVAGSLVLLGGLTSLVLIRAKRLPYLMVGWLWYLGTLFPVIGLVQVGYQAMADRFTTIPHIGLFTAAAWGCWDLFSTRARSRFLLPLAAGLALCLLAVSTRFQLQPWRDNTSLFSHALMVSGDNFLVRNCLGIALAREGRGEEAVAHFLESHRLRPGYLPPLRSLGSLMTQQGRLAEARLYYTKALQLSPEDPSIHNSLGNVLAWQGNRAEAIVHFRKAIEARPDFAAAQRSLNALLKQE